MSRMSVHAQKWWWWSSCVWCGVVVLFSENRDYNSTASLLAQRLVADLPVLRVPAPVVFASLASFNDCDASAVSCVVTVSHTRQHRACVSVPGRHLVPPDPLPWLPVSVPLPLPFLPAGHARMMLLTSALKSCHSPSLSAFLRKYDASSVSPNLF